MSVPADNFRIDQTVHGYRNGHRRLAGSIELDQRSASTMLNLSDLLGEPTGSDSYLVGYPLKEMNRFVLARTWMAREMPRPGCVWTHSLLVDYSMLARIPEPGLLARLFERPTLSTLGAFENPVQLPLATSEHGRDDIDFDRSRRVLAELYGGSGPVTDVSVSAESDEALALSLWRQMWSRLRRSFFFCTAAASPVPNIDVEASFQVIVGADARHRELRLRKAGGAIEPSEGLDALAADLPERGETDLRRFLARFAPELSNQRAAAVTLAEIFPRLSRAKTTKDLRSALRFIRTSLPPGEGRLLKSDFIGGRFRDPDRSGPQAGLDFAAMLEVWGSDPSPVDDATLTERLTDLEASGHLDHGVIVQSGPTDGAKTLAATTFRLFLERYPLEVARAARDEPTKLSVARTHPTLLREPAFWEGTVGQRDALVDFALKSGLTPLDLFGLIEGDIADGEIQKLIGLGGTPVVERLLSRLPDGGRVFESVRSWAPRVARSPQHLGELLRQLVDHPGLVEEVVLAAVGTPGEYAIETSFLIERVADWTPFAVHLPAVATLALLRGLSAPRSVGGTLITFGLDPVLASLFQRNLAPPLTNALDDRLPRLNWHTVGTLEQRVIGAVVSAFLAVDKPDVWILLVTNETSLLRGILELIDDRTFSRRLLKDLHAQARKRSFGVPNDRVDLLESIVWPYGRGGR